MQWKWHSHDEIAAKLAAVEAEVRRGAPVTKAVRMVGVSEATYFRWRARCNAGESENASGVSAGPSGR